MKVTKNFTPVSITLTFETQEEVSAALAALVFNDRIPDAIARCLTGPMGWDYEKTKQKARTVMDQVRLQLAD